MSEREFDAFLSYAREADGRYAAALQTGVERFATPWWRQRTLRIFRDDASMSADPDLWGSIERALASSDWFVLLAAPESRQSGFVAREVDWWLTNRSADRLIVVLTAGDLVWPAGGTSFDWARSTALTPEPFRRLTTEPRWIDARWARGQTGRGADGQPTEIDVRDPRMRENVADVAARIRGMDKDILVGEHVQLHRRAMRLARTGAAALVLLLLVSVVAAFLAISRGAEATRQRDVAQQQTEVAQARLLSASAQAEVGRNLQRAQLLAAHAYRLDPSPETVRALWDVGTASPHLVRFLDAGSEVTETAGNEAGTVAFAGTTTGDVLRWDVASGTREVLGTLAGPVSGLAASVDGSVVAATAEGEAVYWDARGRHAWPTPEMSGAEAAVSADGGIVAIGGSMREREAHGVWLLDRASGQVRVAALELPSEPEHLAFTRDGALTVSDNTMGQWHQVSLADLSVRASGVVWHGVHTRAFAVAPDGGAFARTSGGDRVDVTVVPGDDHGEPTAFGQDLGTAPTALAISPTGDRLAVGSDTGTVYVSPINASGTGEVTTLTGLGDVVPGTLRFTSADRLLAGSGNAVSVWDLNTPGRLVREQAADVPATCAACAAADLVPSGDGGHVWLWSGSDSVLHDLQTGAETVVPVTQAESAFPPVPLRDGRFLLSGPSPGQVQIRSVRDPATREDSWSVPWDQGQVVWSARAVEDGTRVLWVTDLGTVVSVDVAAQQATELVTDVIGPDALRTGHSDTVGTWVPPTGAGAWISADGDLVVADVYDGDVTSLRVRDLGSDRIEGLDAWQFAGFLGDRMLVTDQAGRLATWQPDQPGSPSLLPVPVAGRVEPSPAGDVVAVEGQGRDITLLHSTGAVLGQLPGLARSPDRRGMAFTRDGRHLLVATAVPSADPAAKGQMVSWAADPEAWVDIACATAGRDLTPDEWRAVAGSEPPDDLACGA